MFKPVAGKLDIPALEREQIEVWRERERWSATSRAMSAPSDVSASWTGRSRPTTRWASTTPGAAPTKTSTSATTPCSASSQRYQNGFDCQGLWIEVEVEKELGFKNKRDIEAFGDRPLRRAAARRASERFAAMHTEQSNRLGYVDGLGQQLLHDLGREQLHHLGLPEDVPSSAAGSTSGHDVMPWCPRCGTGLSNMEIATEGYRELTHLSLTVRLPHHQQRARGRGPVGLDDDALDPVANVAAAVHPELTYVLVEGARRPTLVDERTARSRGSRGDATVVARGEGLRAGRPDLPRPVRRAAGRRPASSTA